MEAPQSKFRVVIVGGSIAGLTLAHGLLRNNIDFVVLESRDDIAPQVGASISINPNGSRIFDQIGVFDEIRDLVEPLRQEEIWSDSGKLITRSVDLRLVSERLGYPAMFLDRQAVLAILYKHLGAAQSRVLLNKKVTEVDHLPEKVVVHCADNTTFEGDLVVGADGVRSTIRYRMWDYMETRGLIRETAEERKRMKSEYNCVFGIAEPTPGLVSGMLYRTYGEGYSLLVISSKHGRVYYFFFAKMDKVYTGNDTPQYSQADLEEQVAKYLGKPVTGTVPFSEVIQRTVTQTMVPLEEALFKHWCMDRFVCIGDSIHKMTPNLGQGGMCAIESAASLANSLATLVVHDASEGKNISASSSSSISVDEIHRCLKNWEAARLARIPTVYAGSRDLTRIEALASPKYKFIAFYILPYFGSYLLDLNCLMMTGSVKLDCEPAPARSLQCTMAYTDSYPQTSADKAWKRALKVAPLVACYAAASATMGAVVQKTMPYLIKQIAQGTWMASNGEVINLTEPIYHVQFLDNLLGPMALCFLPSISGSDPQSRLQMLSFMTDLSPVYGIWLLESLRNSESWYKVLLPITAGIASQFCGIGMIAPLYFAVEYIATPLSRILPGHNRIIDPSTTGALLVSLLGSYNLITYANFIPRAIETRHWYNAIWQLFPVTLPLLQLPIALLARRLFPRPPPADPDAKTKIQRRNIRTVRFFYRTLALVSGLTFIYTRFTKPQGTPMASLFFPGLTEHLAPVTSFSQGITLALQYDQLMSVASGFVWLALRFRELKERQESRSEATFSWWKAVGACAASTFALGPGATFALGWGWREEMLEQLAVSMQSGGSGHLAEGEVVMQGGK
ncbi:FAD-dependent oxidoreductase [Aspergillus saccharolyticus JOP 1030-1]|uniref:FAD/NAD(P)-binding domain-containing protein n=1 Tax=Aspergillus saccharolyticus JOP 1030-1 TaxID=1450539 RepID=A0A318ZLY2_9EURO|nr:FAD/NAD(P)-binding domain-containing protein [Aspergillus saccharolyticus JOP 1030-1]PYH44830.1 FAD/NAD(P)-binding domain-containing protein [Aspergillus saccharolyticus JOP 1030-1]